MKASVAAR